MSIIATHEMPDGSGIVEIQCAEEVGRLVAFPTYQEADSAAWSMLSDNPNSGLLEAEASADAEIAAQRPYAKYESMGYARLALVAILATLRIRKL